MIGYLEWSREEFEKRIHGAYAPSSVSQIQARETDIRALSELTLALDKKEAILIELKAVNDSLISHKNETTDMKLSGIAGPISSVDSISLNKQLPSNVVELVNNSRFETHKLVHTAFQMCTEWKYPPSDMSAMVQMHRVEKMVSYGEHKNVVAGNLSAHKRCPLYLPNTMKTLLSEGTISSLVDIASVTGKRLGRSGFTPDNDPPTETPISDSVDGAKFKDKVIKHSPIISFISKWHKTAIYSIDDKGFKQIKDYIITRT
ncbi:DNA binding protein [Artemisia annua]|uniref:DNA binding protein n=1 Tax=Artemisia annua TaxID=35608 RepID=A0A2U1KCZ3_ARTAN|nr:DNA binding protein [Artemisia annua]